MRVEGLSTECDILVLLWLVRQNLCIQVSLTFYV